jgi:hypothetical protein
MKHFLLSLLLTLPLVSSAQTAHPRHRASHSTAVTPRQSTALKVYVCGGDSAYAYSQQRELLWPKSLLV